MPIETDLLALMFDTVQIASRTGQDQYGQSTYGSNLPYQCRIEYDDRPMEMPTVSSANRAGAALLEHVYVAGVNIFIGQWIVVAINDRVTLPDGRILSIKQVKRFSDDRGPYYTEIIA